MRRIIFLSAAMIFLAMACSKRLTPVERGAESFEAQDYAAARTQFESILATGEHNAEALYYLGRIALATDDVSGAIEHLEKAVSLDTENSEYHLRLGVAYGLKIRTLSFMEQGQLAPKMLTEFQRAVETDSTNIDARGALAQFYLQAPPIAGGSEAKAMEQIEAIRDIDPKRGHLFMAQVHERKKAYDLAETELEAALALDPADMDTQFRMGMLYQTMENYPDAFAAFDACLAADANNMNALYQVARTAIFAESNYERGIACINTYLDNEPDPGQPTWAHAYWRRGMIYEKMGDVDKAKQDFAAALEMDPTVEGAKEGLERMKP